MYVCKVCLCVCTVGVYKQYVCMHSTECMYVFIYSMCVKTVCVYVQYRVYVRV
jgi:hypothetical protein